MEAGVTSQLQGQEACMQKTLLEGMSSLFKGTLKEEMSNAKADINA